MANHGPDYYLVTRETEERPNPWIWEIRRHSKPMPIRVLEKGFRSQMAAEFAGKRELDQFLKIPKDCLLGAARRKTLICCLSTQISASSVARARIRSTSVQKISLQRSVITR